MQPLSNYKRYLLTYEINKRLRPGTEKQRLERISAAFGNEHADLATVLVDVADINEALDGGGANGLGGITNDGVHNRHCPMREGRTRVDLLEAAVVGGLLRCYSIVSANYSNKRRFL